MKNRTTSTTPLFFACAIACFAMLACNEPNPNLGADHQEAVELTETMRLTHKGMMERLDFLKTENKEFKRRVNDAEPPIDSLKQIVALQDSLINVFEGMCKEQKNLIDNNEDYLKKHERRSLDEAKIAEQHLQIRQNYERLQLQAAAVVHEVENIKIRIDGAPLPDKAQ
jgi:hypothetical protein